MTHLLPITDPAGWSNDELIAASAYFAAAIGYQAKNVSARDASAAITELVRRYQISIRNERARYESAAATLGVRAPIDRETQ